MSWGNYLDVLRDGGPGTVCFGYDAPCERAWELHNCNGHIVGGLLPSPPWTVVSADPLTVSPSIHCVLAKDGCGLHGFIREGKWVAA